MVKVKGLFTTSEAFLLLKESVNVNDDGDGILYFIFVH